MSETRWTAGPWQVADGFKIVGQGRRIADTLIDSGTAVAEQQANANLIAAAPDLYEALELMLQRYGYETCEYVQKASTALTKARGEQ